MNLVSVRKGAAAVLTVFLLAGCGGGAGELPTPTQVPYDPKVQPYSAEDAVPYMEISYGAGDLPCGVFNVNGHGPKVATLSAFPSCTATSFTVACLNGEAQWTDEFISDIVVSTGEVTFTSAQDGICALFPTD